MTLTAVLLLDGKRYFTWDSNLFPHPKAMQDKLWSQGRRMVR